MSQRKGAVTSRSVYVILPAIVSALALSGCLDKKGDAGQVAARINDSDITIHQVNYRLQQDRNLRPENVEAASRLVLTQLVDQELVAQKRWPSSSTRARKRCRPWKPPAARC